jgi:hypothetical protein
MAAPAYDTRARPSPRRWSPALRNPASSMAAVAPQLVAHALRHLVQARPSWRSLRLRVPENLGRDAGPSPEIRGRARRSPWVTTGVHPQYVRQFVFDQMLWKARSRRPMLTSRILKPDAWKARRVRGAGGDLPARPSAATCLEGWGGLDHTQSQNEWLQGRAAFIPVGTWLEKRDEGLDPARTSLWCVPRPRPYPATRSRRRHLRRWRGAVHRALAG